MAALPPALIRRTPALSRDWRMCSLIFWIMRRVGLLRKFSRAKLLAACALGQKRRSVRRRGDWTHDEIVPALHAPPDVKRAEDSEGVGSEVGRCPGVLDSVGFLLEERRREEGIAVGEDGSEGEGLLEAAEEGSEKAELSDRSLDGELEEDSSERGELLLAVDGSDHRETRHRGVDSSPLGRLDRGGKDVLDGEL